MFDRLVIQFYRKYTFREPKLISQLQAQTSRQMTSISIWEAAICLLLMFNTTNGKSFQRNRCECLHQSTNWPSVLQSCSSLLLMVLSLLWKCSFSSTCPLSRTTLHESANLWQTGCPTSLPYVVRAKAWEMCNHLSLIRTK